MIGLLIIDMQKGAFEKGVERYDWEGVIHRINNLAKLIRKTGNKVIFIQHNGTPYGEYIPGTHEWELISDLKYEPEDIIIEKSACDAFYKTKLEEELTRLGIKKILITGCATDFCVDSTVRAATSKDYDVTVVKDGHTASDRLNINAKNVIDYHNHIWEGLLLPDNNLKVQDTEQILNILSEN